MPVKLTQTETDMTYFCTFTCLDWISLFQITNTYDEIYKWFSLLTKNNHQILGFVIMPNHLHLLIHIKSSDKSINTILSNGKRFLAYKIVRRLKEQRNDSILKKLSDSLKPDERARQKKHRIFQPSSDIKPCYSEEFLVQKLDYIHYNPVKGKWNLAEDFSQYHHSSACFYYNNAIHPFVEITHYKDAGE